MIVNVLIKETVVSYGCCSLQMNADMPCQAPMEVSLREDSQPVTRLDSVAETCQLATPTRWEPQLPQGGEGVEAGAGRLSTLPRALLEAESFSRAASAVPGAEMLEGGNADLSEVACGSHGDSAMASFQMGALGGMHASRLSRSRVPPIDNEVLLQVRAAATMEQRRGRRRRRRRRWCPGGSAARPRGSCHPRHADQPGELDWRTMLWGLPQMMRIIAHLVTPRPSPPPAVLCAKSSALLMIYVGALRSRLVYPSQVDSPQSSALYPCNPPVLAASTCCLLLLRIVRFRYNTVCCQLQISPTILVIFHLRAWVQLPIPPSRVFERCFFHSTSLSALWELALRGSAWDFEI